MKTLIIIPTYNERENITKLLSQICDLLPQAHIVVVDDNSPDGTAQEVEHFAATTGFYVKLMKRTGERGLGKAYKTGFSYGLSHDYDTLITMDADLSHNPTYLPDFLHVAPAYDVVIGSRYVFNGGTINWALWRMGLSWCANTFARLLLNLHGHDLTSGYRLYHRTILEKIDLERINSDGYSFLVEVLFYIQQHHGRIHEIPIIFFNRTVGASKISKQEIYFGALTLFRLRVRSFFTKPHERILD